MAERPEPEPDVGDPRVVLDRLLTRAAARLEERRVELAEMRSALAALVPGTSADGALVGFGPPAAPAWEPVSAELTAPLVGSVLARSPGLVRSCTTRLEQGPGLSEGAIPAAQGRDRAGHRQRTLYPLSCLETPAGRRWLRACAVAGEEQRVMTDPPTDFVVFGQDLVITVAQWGEADSPHVLVRDPMLVAAFTALFDVLFHRALPVPVAGSATEDDRRLLGLLALGIKDEAIGRYLGWSLRTVRRRVSRLMDAHAVQTRFQLGAAAAREGLVAVGHAVLSGREVVTAPRGAVGADGQRTSTAGSPHGGPEGRGPRVG